MHESYVSLEIAKLLKKLGFKWGCRAAWDLTFPDEPYLNYDAVYQTDFNNDVDDILYAPTLSVAQRWLREVKNCQVEIMYMYDKYGINIGKYVVIYTVQDRIHESLVDEESEQPIKLFEVYEKAQEAGIKKCLDVLLEEE